MEKISSDYYDYDSFITMINLTYSHFTSQSHMYSYLSPTVNETSNKKIKQKNKKKQSQNAHKNTRFNSGTHFFFSHRRANYVLTNGKTILER